MARWWDGSGSWMVLRLQLRAAQNVVSSGSFSAVSAAYRNSKSAISLSETSECPGIHWIVNFGL